MAKRILIVDDDPDIREMTGTLLGSAGYEVVGADSAADAQAKLADQAFDLLILDVMMETKTEGFHLVYKIREDPKYKSVPIIMLTNVEDWAGEHISEGVGSDFLPVQAFLPKPADMDELKAKVAELLGDATGKDK